MRAFVALLAALAVAQCAGASREALDRALEGIGETARALCKERAGTFASPDSWCEALESTVELALRAHVERLARVNTVPQTTVIGVLGLPDVTTKIRTEVSAMADWMFATKKSEWVEDIGNLATDLEDDWNARFRTWFAQTVKSRKGEIPEPDVPAKKKERDATEKPDRRRRADDAARSGPKDDIDERSRQWEKEFESRREERRKMREDMEREWAGKFDRPDMPGRAGAGAGTDDIEARIREMRESMDRRRRGEGADEGAGAFGPQPRRKKSDDPPPEDIDYDTAEGKCRACQLSASWVHEELKRFLDRPGFGLSDNLMMAGAHRACSKHVIGRDYGSSSWDDPDRRRRGPSMWMSMRKDCIDLAERHRGDLRRLAESGSAAEASRLVCEEKERVCHAKRDEL